MQLSLFQKIKSFLYPVLVRKTTTHINPVLELYTYKGRWQLASMDALYSDGDQYRPLLAAFKAIENDLLKVGSVLVLGTGLGSAVHVLRKMNFFPTFTLVELDQKVLEWAMELLPAKNDQKIEPVCADALSFVQTNPKIYDLIVVDIFINRTVPDFVLSNEFLQQCKKKLSTNGKLVLNYMVQSLKETGAVKALLEHVFSEVKEISFYLNRVYIATV